MKQKILFSIISIPLFMSCEYERIDDEFDCSISPISLEIASNNTSCGANDGSITLIANGGSGVYEFQLNNNGFLGANEFNNLGSSIYTITARDVDTGCEISQQVTIDNEDGFSVNNISITESDCDTPNGTITIEVQDAVGNVSYSLGGTSQNENTFTGLEADTYDITIRDETGCEVILRDLEVLSNISLMDDIQPIISTNCAISGCHDGSQSPNLSTRDGIVSNSGRIQSRTSAGTMPPSGPLPQGQIDAIICWVDSGSPNN